MKRLTATSPGLLEARGGGGWETQRDEPFFYYSYSLGRLQFEVKTNLTMISLLEESK